MIVTAAGGAPRFSRSLVDRFLVAAEAMGARATIVYNKSDLLPPPASQRSSSSSSSAAAEQEEPHAKKKTKKKQLQEEEEEEDNEAAEEGEGNTSAAAEAPASAPPSPPPPHDLSPREQRVRAREARRARQALAGGADLDDEEAALAEYARLGTQDVS